MIISTCIHNLFVFCFPYHPVAIEACLLNSQLNNVSISVCGENLIGSNCDDYDAVFVGDMLYDSTLSSTITEWLRGLKNRGKTVLIGDPGRTGRDDSLTYFRLIAKYELDPVTKKDNSGFNHTFVYTIIWIILCTNNSHILNQDLDAIKLKV